MTERTLSLVPLSLRHVDDFVRYCGEPSLWTWWLRKPPLDAEGMRNEVERALAQQKSGHRTPFAIFHRERAEHIGSTSLWDVDNEHRSVEIGSTWLALPFHGTGVNRECKELLLTYAFDELRMNRVVFQTDELNLRSRRAIEKLGAKLDGVMREDKIVWDGRLRSSAMYSILRSEWRPLTRLAAIHENPGEQ
ncbi:MAG: GNAT family N-acetyltransferase [Opitutales bacterium]|nr:GNAT family N-acetyltransferase [Opitutales bacterium]